MNDSIQQEIAAPKDCKKRLWLLLIALVNLAVLTVSFIVSVTGRHSAFDEKYNITSIFICSIVTIALIVAVLLRKNHTLMLAVLSLAAVDIAALRIYFYASLDVSIAVMAWRMVTVSLTFILLIFTLVFIGFYFSKPRETKAGAMNFTKYLNYCAMFTALSIVCKIIGNSITAVFPVAGAGLKITIVYIPWVLGGIVLGPIGGFAAAALGDFIGQLAVSTGGLPLPELTIANGYFAVFPALAYKLFKCENTKVRCYVAIGIGTFVSAVLCTLGISTFTLYVNFYQSSSFWVYFATVRLPQLIIIGANVPIMILLSTALVNARIIKQPITKFFD